MSNKRLSLTLSKGGVGTPYNAFKKSLAKKSKIYYRTAGSGKIMPILMKNENAVETGRSQ